MGVLSLLDRAAIFFDRQRIQRLIIDIPSVFFLSNYQICERLDYMCVSLGMCESENTRHTRTLLLGSRRRTVREMRNEKMYQLHIYIF